MGHQNKTVWVVFWEYCNGSSAGGGGFNWYAVRSNALDAYEAEEVRPDTAKFFFPYEADPDDDADTITEAIDCDLIECCAKAAVREVGDGVLAYWKANGFDMGNATEPAPAPIN